jgi:hypothetical protein
VAGRAKQNELNSSARSGAFFLAADPVVSRGKKLTVAGDQKFESISLHQRVSCEPDFNCNCKPW